MAYIGWYLVNPHVQRVQNMYGKGASFMPSYSRLNLTLFSRRRKIALRWKVGGIKIKTAAGHPTKLFTLRKAKKKTFVIKGRVQKTESLSLFTKLPCPNYLIVISFINWPKQNTLLEFLRWPKTTISLLLQRKITIVASVATLLTDIPTWKPTCWFTAERSPLFVHSATTLATKLATLEAICEPTQEKSLTIVNSVTFPAHWQVTSRSTW